MYVKNITYTDFKGNERSEEFQFHLKESDIAEWELSHDGGLSTALRKLIMKQDVPGLSSLVKDLIAKSYGEISDDGRRFVKSKEIFEAFSETEAYSKFYMDLLTNQEELAAFVNGIMPKSIRDNVDLNKEVTIAGKNYTPITGEVTEVNKDA